MWKFLANVHVTTTAELLLSIDNCGSGGVLGEVLADSIKKRDDHICLNASIETIAILN
jgi:hypothetical protein